MSKIVNPFAHRLPIIRDWRSRWFSVGSKFKENLRGDVLIREYLTKKLRNAYISSVEIERSRKLARILIRTSRPGIVIGRSGEGSKKLMDDTKNFMKKNKISMPEDFKIEVVPVANPDADAAIVAYSIAEALEKRMPFRRVMKQTIEKVSTVREVQGVRIVLGGRLGGAEIARSEELKKGSIPLQTFRADVDFARERAHLPYGDVGIRVWIYRGEKFDSDK